MIAIIDYGLGNLHSVQKALNFLGIPNIITYKKNIIQNSKGIILPGVGSFEQGMKNLKERDLTEILTNEIIIKNTIEHLKIKKDFSSFPVLLFDIIY